MTDDYAACSAPSRSRNSWGSWCWPDGRPDRLIQCIGQAGYDLYVFIVAGGNADDQARHSSAPLAEGDSGRVLADDDAGTLHVPLAAMVPWGHGDGFAECRWRPAVRAPAWRRRSPVPHSLIRQQLAGGHDGRFVLGLEAQVHVLQAQGEDFRILRPRNCRRWPPPAVAGWRRHRWRRWPG